MEHKNLKNRVGESNINFQGLKMTILEYKKAIDLTVQFEDGTVVKNTAYKEFSSGSIKNLNHPSVFGKGYMGEGEYKAWGGTKLTKEYSTWFGMLTRCYDEKFHKKQPTYRGCTVDEKWHNFQVFAKWFEENYNPETMQGWQLDKDILVRENKLYSPETCIFVPQAINSMFTSSGKSKRDLPTGVYYLRGRYQVSTPTNDKSTYVGFYKTEEEAVAIHKIAKEKYMKEEADKWKPYIDSRVYEAMYNYQVEITD